MEKDGTKASIVILDSLLLLSYGNKGLGSLIVYLFTIGICLISFFHSFVDSVIVKSKLKVMWYTAIGGLLAVVSLLP